MNIFKLPVLILTGFALSGVTTFSGCQEIIPAELPNILWITSEDNSPFFGCYGDTFATTPNFDKLASQGFLYTHAYANAPVCAPTRNTILTGVYACSSGNEHMRSFYKKSDIVKPYPVMLREAGYYCSNNSKEDYNFDPALNKNIWDESSNKAHYKNRKPGQPFFAVFNVTISHESSIHTSIPNGQLRHDPEKVPLPPYHPRTEEMKHDWAQYYDKIEDLDTRVGNILKELEDNGLTGNTIVFYYGDHGGVIARSKRYVYESGTHVPFIIRIPEKFKYLWPGKKPGSRVDRLISFVDLSPTLLSIAGIRIPDFLQGQPFLGKQKTRDPEFAFMFRGRMDERYDMSRAVRDKKFRYIRNYMPYRIYGQHLDYLWRAPSIRSWEQAFLRGECNEVQSRFWKFKPVEELYDSENDRWEVNNLATDPAYADVLEKMRQAETGWVKNISDAGFIPEPDRAALAGEMPVYDYLRSGRVSVNRIIDAAQLSTLGKKENFDSLLVYLKSNVSAIRYWGATGMLMLGADGQPAVPALKKALNDTSPSVVAVASEALYKLGEADIARKALISVLSDSGEFARCYALNVIDCIGDSTPDVQRAVLNIALKKQAGGREFYDLRAARGLIDKWKIDPAKEGIKFNW